jgi:hypothetical protein
MASGNGLGVNSLMFHGDRQRRGWNANETILTPDNVATAVGKLWDTGQLDTINIGGTDFAPHMYASPLYVDQVLLTGGKFAGQQLSVIVAATGNGYVYAINALEAPGVPAGTILWRTFLGMPSRNIQDSGVPIGVLGTPAIDPDANPPTIYVASDVTPTGPTDPARTWKVFAIDLTSGAILPGWPLDINNDTLGPINENGPATFGGARIMSQRGGLNLSLDRSILYVPFGSYNDGGAGWMVAVDTGIFSGNPALASAFSGAPWTAASANAGMWASGGPSVDNSGNVFVVTGNSPSGPRDRTWGESVLRWGPALPLLLNGSYTVWNHCQLDDRDIDLCGSGVTLLPDLDPATTSNPFVMAVGGKQGNAYLIDRDNLPGALDRRPDCNRDNPTAEPTDKSFWDPTAGRPYYGGNPGPLNVFGPYSETDSMGNLAKARSTPAYFRSADGTHFLFFTGSTKTCPTCQTVMPPCLARLKVVAPAFDQPPYLVVDATENTLIFKSPGTPVISSNGSDNAIVWVVEPNLYRGDPMIPGAHPTLHAIDATTMQILYSSGPDDLLAGGKYYHPVVARGFVFVGTDRITAFGLSTTKPRK